MKYFSLILENKNWLILATVVFFGALILASIGAVILPDFTLNLFSQFFSDIQDIGDKIFDANPIWGTWQLFINNLRASLVFIVGGFILAIPTFIGLALNGGAIGALGVISTLDGINPLLFLLAIIPHGIIEIPAILISGGLGLRLGSEIINPRENMSRLYNLKINLLLVIKTLPIIVVLLFIAAIIEIFITPNLLNLFVDF
ncbi:stage II sporulation protein M [Natranaerofaba carboxydovora]|uniref:stage II sporulation protein M n=1 Tax=Natranaerofaba carboxydovora TaxID=2742683 RepID=UPI001F1313C7|nr:stage II sporulation protein M [Natranaerofaba carboxydovora]UMZ75080.1 Stage II sporulation protein M [Natranaerofaba carboxydovora]